MWIPLGTWGTWQHISQFFHNKSSHIKRKFLIKGFKLTITLFAQRFIGVSQSRDAWGRQQPLSLPSVLSVDTHSSQALMRVPMKMVFLSCDWTTEPSQSSNSINGFDGVFSRLIFTDDVKERNPIVQLLPYACEHIYHIKQRLSKHFNVHSKGYKEFTGFVYQCLAVNTFCCSFCQYLHFHFLWRLISLKWYQFQVAL